VLALTKDDIALKLERLIGREVSIVEKIKFSSNWVSDYVNYSGILKSFYLGEEYEEDIIALIKVVVMTGKKKNNRRDMEIWVDARDIVGILEGGKARKTTSITKSSNTEQKSKTKTTKTTKSKVVEEDIDMDDWSGDYV
jgi:hypothetical protein